jgi:hypothetical protein
VDVGADVLVGPDSADLCHDLGVPVNEEGPGIGVWVACGLGVLAGAFLGWPIAGWIGAVVAFLVVSVVGALLLS